MSYDENGQYQDDFDAPTRRRATRTRLPQFAFANWRGFGTVVRVAGAALLLVCAADPRF